MLSAISQHLQEKFKVFFLTDNILLNNKIIPIVQENFQELKNSGEGKTIAFIDGGQAEILSGGNVCLSFIRVFSQVMKSTAKVSGQKNEFYLLTTAIYKNGDIWYESKLFPTAGESLIDENDLLICSNDLAIRSGNERGPIARVAGIARRLAELHLASRAQADFVLLDGTLTPSFEVENKYLSNKASALTKTCALFTTSGNHPAVLLQKLSPFAGCWSYAVDGKTFFVKLHPRAEHIFRFEGNPNLLPVLVSQCGDALFVGYPYGLILADKLARVSNEEKRSLRMNFLLRPENTLLRSYLNTMNAHEILDGMG